MTDQQIEERIKEYFEENYELLRLEGGHALTEETKRIALEQIIYYWRKLKDIATKVSETEVKLSLPDQITPKGRKFSIEGIVDIVREENETWMYDIKTHDPNYVVTHQALYEKQLNVYSYIWQHLRGNILDHTAIIATTLPQSLRAAISEPDNKRLEYEFSKWEPVINIPYKKENVESTIKDFAKIVDLIEENKFTPPDKKKLETPLDGTKIRFATRICRNCDARFSCSSFRDYIQSLGAKTYSTFKKYFEDLADDVDQEQWISGNLQNSPPPDNVEPIG